MSTATIDPQPEARPWCATDAYGRILTALWARVDGVVATHGALPLADVRASGAFLGLRMELALLGAAPERLLPKTRLPAAERLRLAALAGGIATSIDRADERLGCRAVLERAQDEIWSELATARAVEWLELLGRAADRANGTTPART